MPYFPAASRDNFYFILNLRQAVSMVYWICKNMPMGFTQQNDKLEFGELTDAISNFLSLRESSALLSWQSPSNSRTRNVIHRRGAHLERPAEKFLIFRFLSAKRCYLTEIFAKTHGTIPSGTQRRNDNTPGPSRLVSRHCRPRLGPGPCPAGAQDERPYEV